jgi:hypothetical protein
MSASSEKFLQLFRDFRDKNDALSPHGQNLSDIELKHIMRMVNIVEFKPYECLINKGEEASWVGFLLSGVLSVLDDKDQHEITTLHPGAFVGEMALLEGGYRSAEVMGKAPEGADEDTFVGTIAILRFDLIDNMHEVYPALAYKLLMAFASDGMGKLRRTIDLKSGKKQKRKSTFRRMGQMEKNINKQGKDKKWEELAKKEIIYRQKIVKMKTEESQREQDLLVANEEHETEMMALKHKLDNERHIAKRSKKQMNMLKDELKAAHAELHELQGLRKQMMSSDHGEKLHRLQRKSSLVSAQLQTAVQQKERWRKKALEREEAMSHHRRLSTQLKTKLGEFDAKYAQLKAERDSLMEQAELYKRLHGDHALLGDQLAKTLQELAALKKRLAAQEEYIKQLIEKLTTNKRSHDRACRWLTNLIKQLSHKLKFKRTLLDGYVEWARRSMQSTQEALRGRTVDVGNLNTVIKIMNEKQRQHKRKIINLLANMRKRIKDLTESNAALASSNGTLQGGLIATYNKLMSMKQLNCLLALHTMRETKLLNERIAHFQHEREGLLLARDKAESSLSVCKRQREGEKMYLNDRIDHLCRELKEQKERHKEEQDTAKREHGTLKEKYDACQSATIAPLTLRAADLEEQNKMLKQAHATLQREHDHVLKEYRSKEKLQLDMVNEAESLQREAEKKTNYVLHRLRASEARRIELENGFGKAYTPSHDVVRLMEEVNEISHKTFRRRGKGRKKRPQTTSTPAMAHRGGAVSPPRTALVSPHKSWQSPFKKRIEQSQQSQKRGIRFSSTAPRPHSAAMLQSYKNRLDARMSNKYRNGTLDALSTHSRVGLGESLLDNSESCRFKNHGVVVLLVDSDERNLAAMHDMLHSSGFCSRHARNMKEVKDALDEFPFDIVVSRQLFGTGKAANHSALELLQYIYEEATHRAERVMLKKVERTPKNTPYHTFLKLKQSSIVQDLSVRSVLSRIPKVIVLQDFVANQTFERANFVHRASGCFEFLSMGRQQGSDINECVQKAISLSSVNTERITQRPEVQKERPRLSRPVSSNSSRKIATRTPPPRSALSRTPSSSMRGFSDDHTTFNDLDDMNTLGVYEDSDQAHHEMDSVMEKSLGRGGYRQRKD